MSEQLSRRGFLRMFGGAAAAIAAPTYFLPPIGGWKQEPKYHYTYLIGDDFIETGSMPLPPIPVLPGELWKLLAKHMELTELATGALMPPPSNKIVQMEVRELLPIMMHLGSKERRR